MYDAMDFQVRYGDHQRQVAWMGEAGWQFDPPTTRKRFRVTLAQALVALASRLSPAMGQPRTA